ncbi:MAG: protein kinase [Myxococcales bacterium]|nr:protein kinase [Myxococcales bacterium]MCB9750999.1 protein kinase [Myxococcales bacterium]
MDHGAKRVEERESPEERGPDERGSSENKSQETGGVGALPVAEGLSELLNACAEQRVSGTLSIERRRDRLVLYLERGRLIEVGTQAATRLPGDGSARRREARADDELVSGQLDERSGGPLSTPQHTPTSRGAVDTRGSSGEGRARPLEPGTELDKYRVERLLGVGGNSYVYRARHILLDTPVAIKVVHPSMRAAQPGRVHELFNEARIAARLNHPNIVRVTDLIHEDGLLGVVMELVQGKTLRELIAERGRIRPFDVVALGLDIAAGLGEAASCGLVHRDVKPSNIMLTTSGVAKLLDLGLAQRFLARTGDAPPDAGALRGTPLYMAPEQFLNPGDVNVRSDMFALGITLYEALVGRPPFASQSVSELIFKRIEESLTPPHVHVPTVPRALSLLIMELMQSDPERRPNGYDVIVGRLKSMRAHLFERRPVEPDEPPIAAPEPARDEAPRAAAQAGEERSKERAALPEEFNARHVLLVEDSRVNQLLIRRMLEEINYQVSVASDGLEALERVRTTRYGAILMDCELPRMNGYAATRLVRALETGRGHRTPIIALTANILPGDRRRAQEAGMDDFLTKPVNSDRLEATLAHWQRRLGIC